MSRAGYSSDGDIGDEWSLIMYRGAVASALRGRRGQAFLREMRAALDEMPQKRLVKEVMVEASIVVAVDGCDPAPIVNACALGVVAMHHNIDVSTVDPYDHDNIHAPFNIANALAREIMFENDESWPFPKTPEERWRKMRWWVEANIKNEKDIPQK